MEEKKFNPSEHLIQLKGKDYLQVMYRLIWFREEKPNWGIETSAIKFDEKSAVFTAKVYDEKGVLKSCGHGSETKSDFGDFLEKAETKAVGRALAMLGYGTQFAPELDEGERIVDSPVKREKKAPVNGEELPTYNADRSAGKKSGKKADKAGLEKILSAAGGDVDAAKAACLKYGYARSADVLAKDVDEICNYLNERVPWDEDSK